MTTPADQLRAAADLLGDTELYLSALHGSVARHDHLGANLTCGGCQLRDRITPALAVARQVLGTVTGQPVAACRCGHPQERHALLSGTYAQCRHKYTEAGRPKCPCGMYRPQGDAPTTQVPAAPEAIAADRAAILCEAADRYATLADQNEAYDREHGELDEAARIQHGAVRDVAAGLRHMADEAQPAAPSVADTQPETEARPADREQRCAHCSSEIEDRGDPGFGAYTPRWVHIHGGYHTCFPHQFSSPHATPTATEEPTR